MMWTDGGTSPPGIAWSITAARLGIALCHVMDVCSGGQRWGFLRSTTVPASRSRIWAANWLRVPRWPSSKGQVGRLLLPADAADKIDRPAGHLLANVRPFA